MCMIIRIRFDADSGNQLSSEQSADEALEMLNAEFKVIYYIIQGGQQR